jgi:SAM-dependent methyltransferase
VKMVNAVRQVLLGALSKSSADYWRRRYRAGLDSGAGSYGELAQFKAGILNDFVRDNRIQSVLELGCGDGNQLSLAQYPRYLGLDVSSEAIDICRSRFPGDPDKAFLFYDPLRTNNLELFLAAELTLSLDVIYHLLEDDVYDQYLQMLFACSRKFVIIYSSNNTAPDVAWHVRNRAFAQDVANRFGDFRLTGVIKNPHRDLTPAEFYVFQRSA